MVVITYPNITLRSWLSSRTVRERESDRELMTDGTAKQMRFCVISDHPILSIFASYFDISLVMKNVIQLTRCGPKYLLPFRGTICIIRMPSAATSQLSRCSLYWVHRFWHNVGYRSCLFVFIQRPLRLHLKTDNHFPGRFLIETSDSTSLFWMNSRH